MMKYGLPSVAALLLVLPGLGMAQACSPYNIKPSTPTNRFVISGNEVTDTQTNLIWQRCPIGTTGTDCTGRSTYMTWAEALAQATGDWRLPNVKELASIVETNCTDPAINQDVFPNTPSMWFWSSSPDLNMQSNAWSVREGDESIPTSKKVAVRLVRGG